MSGRIADVAIDPRKQSTWYVAVGSGARAPLERTLEVAGVPWTPGR